MPRSLVAVLAVLTGLLVAAWVVALAYRRPAGDDTERASPVVPPSRGPVVRADAPWGEIAGRVSDLDGRAVAGALVVAQDLRGFGGLARSGADGRYAISLMRCDRTDPRWPDRGWAQARVPAADAEILVAATADGFTRSNTRRVTAHRGATVEVGPLALYRGGRIEGRVVDAAGREVPARVRVLSVESKDRVDGMQALPPAYPADFVDAPPGRGFVLAPVGPGTVELWATAPGVGTAHGTVEVGEGRTVTVDLPVKVEIHIAGRVVDDAGAGVAGCRVVCRPDAVRTDGPATKVRIPKRPGEVAREDGSVPDEGVLAGRPLATDTDADGRFWFYGVRDGAKHIVSIGDLPAIAVAGVLPGTGDLVLVVPAPRDLTGSVRDAASGAPVAGAALRLFPASERGFLQMTRPLGLADAGRSGPATVADGTFRLPRVFPGSYVLHVTRAGFEVAEVPVDVPGGAAAPVAMDVRLVTAARVEGTVTTQDGRAAAGARLDVSPAPVASLRPGARQGPWSGRVVATADAAGAFAIEGLPAGVDLVLRASDREGRSYRGALNLSRSERRREDVRLRDPATLAVRVRPATGGALAGHPVRLRGIDDPDVVVNAETDEDGIARIEHLPPGRFKVEATDELEDASSPGVAARIATLDLGSGAETPFDVVVPDITVVHGTLTFDADLDRAAGPQANRPVDPNRERENVPAARIGFGPTAATPDHFRPLLFEVRDGTYRGRVPPGRYHVHIAYPGRRYEIAEPVVVPATPDLNLDWALPLD